MIKSFKQHIIDKNEKMCLWNNLDYKYDIYQKKGNKNNGRYIYPCVFIEYINNEVIKIKFDIKINKEFEKDKIIKTNIDSFIIIPEFVYNYSSNLENLDSLLSNIYFFKILD